MKGYSPQQSARHTPEAQQHINELVSQVPSCRALNRDQSLFEAPVRLADGRVTNLRLSIPPSFPEEGPSLQVTHLVQHPWVTPSGRMNFPALEHWSPQRSRLVAVVQEAFSALSGQPLRSPSPHRPGARSTESSPTRPASVPGSFPQVQSMPGPDVLRVLRDPAAYQRLAQEVLQSSNSFQVQQQLRNSNVQLARANLAQEEVLGELRNQIAIIRGSEYAAVKEAFDERNRRQSAVLSRLQPGALVEALAKQAEEAEQAADAVQAAFARGELSNEAFVEQILAARKTFHQRDLKCMAAQQIILA